MKSWIANEITAAQVTEMAEMASEYEPELQLRRCLSRLECEGNEYAVDKRRRALHFKRAIHDAGVTAKVVRGVRESVPKPASPPKPARKPLYAPVRPRVEHSAAPEVLARPTRAERRAKSAEEPKKKPKRRVAPARAVPVVVEAGSQWPWELIFTGANA